jgi:uncharacterized protein YbjQ (UPF0145 family)
MIITTGNDIAMGEIVQYLGVVRGIVIRATSIGATSIGARFRIGAQKDIKTLSTIAPPVFSTAFYSRNMDRRADRDAGRKSYSRRSFCIRNG